MKYSVHALTIIFATLLFTAHLNADEFIADYTKAKESVLRSIPLEYINAAKQDLHILYCGTSHSTQVVDGMRGLMQYKNGDETTFRVTFNGTPVAGALDIHYRGASGTDLSNDGVDGNGHTGYYHGTVSYLDSHPDVNVVMWSWCSIEGHDVERYLNNFSELIDMYRDGGSKGRTASNKVNFVFMTGYARGSNGDTPEPPYIESPYQNHKRIADYCKANGYFCLDYWSQDTHHYETDSYNAHESGNNNTLHKDFFDTHTEGTDWFATRSYSSGAIKWPAHCEGLPQHITSNRRAYAAWWIWARLAGWDGTSGDQPVIASLTDQSVTINDTLEFPVNVTGSQTDDLVYTVTSDTYVSNFQILPVQNEPRADFSWTPEESHIGSHLLTFTISRDSVIQDTEIITITVRDVNHAPEIEQLNDITISENELINFQATAHDRNNDTLSFIYTGPGDELIPGASIHNSTGYFNWRPDYNQAGVYSPITITVSDGEYSDSETFSITVDDVNRPPVLAGIGNRSVYPGETMEIRMSAEDPDGDTMTFQADNLPDGALFNPETRLFTWTPVTDQYDANYQMVFTVLDHGEPVLYDSEEIIISVGDVNHPPVIEEILPVTVNEGDRIEFTVTATDPDEDPMTYEAYNLPEGSVFNHNHTFIWIPDYHQSGEYIIRFNVTDQGLPEENSSVNVEITVEDSNQSPDQPELSYPMDFMDNTGTEFEFLTREFSDIDLSDTHYKTRWQISSTKEFTDDSIIFDLESDTELTSYYIGENILEDHKQYYWRVMFTDSHQNVSEWSDTCCFYTSAHDPAPDDPDEQDNEEDPVHCFIQCLMTWP